MIDLATLTVAITMGFLGSAHCFGMCGGIASALSMQTQSANQTSPNALFLLSYSVGRILSYALAGFLVGSLGFIFADSIGPSAATALRVLAGLLIIALGFAIPGWWRGLNSIESIGAKIWKKLSPLTSAFLPIDSVAKAFMVGSLWGWLPCGLVYSALVWTSTFANPLWSALLMLCFGLGTLPAIFSAGLLAQKISIWVQNQWFRAFSGVMLILFGVWTLFAAVQHSGHHHHPASGAAPSQVERQSQSSDTNHDHHHHHHGH